MLSKSQQGRGGGAVVYYPALGRSRPQDQEALSFGRQKRGSLSTAAPFVLPISFPISSFTCTSQVCVLMTLLPSGSPYFPKDINLLAPLPALPFKCHHSQKKKMLSGLQILSHGLPLTGVFHYIYRLCTGCRRVPGQDRFPRAVPGSRGRHDSGRKEELPMDFSWNIFVLFAARRTVSLGICLRASLPSCLLALWKWRDNSQTSKMCHFPNPGRSRRRDWSLCRSGGGKGEGRLKEPPVRQTFGNWANCVASLTPLLYRCVHVGFTHCWLEL